MTKTSLFGQISVIAIFGTEGLIFQRLAELVEIKPHNESQPARAENVVILPNLADRDFEHQKCDFPKGWPNWLKLTHITAQSLLIPKPSLFGKNSMIANLGTQGVIFQNFSESAKINAHKRSQSAHAQNVVILPNLGDLDFGQPSFDFPKFDQIG